MATADGDAPLVLLPGMNCTERLWRDLTLHAALTPRLTEPDLTGQVERLLDELPERFDLVGLSLGAVVAMALTRSAPERVGRLALLAANPRPPTDAQQTAWAGQRAALASGHTARDLQEDLLPVLLSPTVLDRRPELVEDTLAMADAVGETDLDAQLRLQASRVDERPALHDVGVPTLVVAARLDRLVPVERHEEIHGAVRGSTLAVVEDCAHLSPLERPTVVGALLTRWRSTAA